MPARFGRPEVGGESGTFGRAEGGLEGPKWAVKQARLGGPEVFRSTGDVLEHQRCFKPQPSVQDCR